MMPAVAKRLALAAALACALPPATGRGADVENAEWPCAQVLVPTISIGQVWFGKAPAADAGKTDPEAERLAAEIAARSTPLDDAHAAVDRFAATLPRQERTERLAGLANQTLQRINSQRDSLIAGIKRFASRQRALAERISDRQHSIGKMAPNDPARADLEQSIAWDRRVFDEREASLRYLCEEPVDLERRAFNLGREIYRHVEDN